MRLSRRGISLIEVMVATTLTGWIAVLTAMVLTGARARLEDRKARLTSEQALRAGANAIRAFLQGAQAADSDLQVVAPAGLTIRVVRGSSVLCSVTAGIVVARRGAWWSAVREPVAGRDSLALGTLTGERWILGAVQGAPVSSPCPDGAPGTGLPVALDPAVLVDLGSGSPIRFFEPVELRGYSSSGSDWIGLRQVATGEAIQPLAGPLARPGLALEYFTAAGGSASQPATVSTVLFRIRVQSLDGRADSLSGTVLLPGGTR